MAGFSMCQNAGNHVSVGSKFLWESMPPDPLHGCVALQHTSPTQFLPHMEIKSDSETSIHKTVIPKI